MPFPTMVTDRSTDDLALYDALRTAIYNRTATQDEWDEWLALIKGAYNTVDLNRVGAAIDYLAQELTANGYLVNVTAKQDWAKTDIPLPVQMETYLSDVEAIRSALSVPPSLPPVPDDAVGLNYTEANNIEEILSTINFLLLNMLSNLDNAWAMGIAYTGLFAKEAE